MSSKSMALVAALLGSTAAHPTSCPAKHSTTFSWADTKHVIAFGDSYSYVQGTAGRQNFSFIGDSLNLAFTPETLLTNQIIQNQTSTAEGGPNWLEYLTHCGLSPGLTSPQDCDTQLWDFAFAGADISTAYTPLHHNFTTSLVNQTLQFESYADPVLRGVVEKARTVVAVWIGINDINDSDSYSVDFRGFYAKLIGTLFERMARIRDLGYARFVFVNLPPLDRTPGNVGREGGARPNGTMVEWWGEALAERNEEFMGEEQGTWSKVFDANSFLNRVMDCPGEYGIKNVTGYCEAYDQPFVDTDPGRYGCLPLDEYFWFNDGHMTSHTHEILAKEMERWLKEQS